LAITTGYNDTLIFRCSAGCSVRAILTALRDNYGIVFPYPLAESAFQEHAETVIPAVNHLLRIAAHILMDDAYLALHTPKPQSTETGRAAEVAA
ncbi:hypothetical protein ACH0C8_15610, partial [Acetobacter lovaniensis]|uniref:hypothetical protein n=1 Tax=Acetobacter lovaniensis TaxID=104100 RepID=UPI00376FC4FE